ncbi:MAG: family 16 glycosylhydrolase [Porticoccaceae bacterium]|nr:family 16 glycosylhydrolase [Porticoccaceae bacterium]
MRIFPDSISRLALIAFSYLLLSACSGGGSTNPAPTPADTTAPVITLADSAAISVEQGGTFNAPSATATDEADGDISSSIVVSNPVDANTAGTYEVTYNVADSAGNAATEVTISVTVSAADTGNNGDEGASGLVGNWLFKPAANAFEVGPDRGDGGVWWANWEDDITTRDCFFDDIFRFNADGSFENIMGDKTWLEDWQEGEVVEDCGAPVAPHDGSATGSTYSYDEAAGTLTITGTGAHIGLPKVVNGGEISTGAAVADLITYQVVEMTDTTMTLDISIGVGWWRYKMIKEGTYAAGTDDGTGDNTAGNSGSSPSDLGDPLDSSKWFHQTKLPNGSGWHNNEQQHYTDRNTYVSDGSLKIVAKKESFTQQGHTKQYTSARLNSKFAFTYGRVEVRAKMPTGYGTWPAIWLLGKNITERGAYWETQGFGTTGWPACGEIDIMELWGANPSWVQSAIHTPSSHGGTVNHGGQTISTASSEFHIYTMDWTADRMVFSVDGNVHYTYNPATKNADTWPFDSEQYLLLNVAIESRISASFDESQMEVDYVRVYSPDAAPSDLPIWSDEFDG